MRVDYRLQFLKGTSQAMIEAPRCQKDPWPGCTDDDNDPSQRQPLTGFCQVLLHNRQGCHWHQIRLTLPVTQFRSFGLALLLYLSLFRQPRVDVDDHFLRQYTHFCHFLDVLVLDAMHIEYQPRNVEIGFQQITSNAWDWKPAMTRRFESIPPIRYWSWSG